MQKDTIINGFVSLGSGASILEDLHHLLFISTRDLNATVASTSSPESDRADIGGEEEVRQRMRIHGINVRYLREGYTCGQKEPRQTVLLSKASIQRNKRMFREVNANRNNTLESSKEYKTKERLLSDIPVDSTERN